MKKYFCKNCNYETIDKRNFYKHNKSKRHLEKLNRHETKKPPLTEINQILTGKGLIDSNKSYTCDYCDFKSEYSASLSRHKKRCMSKEKDIFTLENKLKDAEINNILMKKDNDMMKKEKDLMKEHNNFLRQMIISSSKGSGSTLTSTLYEHYADNPSINDIELKKLHIYLKPKIKLINNLLYSFEKNQVHKFLAEFILTIVKKKNYEEQSIFTSDSSRLNYMVKENIFENVSEWVLDKKGIKVLKYIIKPITSQAIEILEKYKLSLLPSANNNISTDDLIELNKKAQIVVKLIGELSDGNIDGKINRYICPYLVMDKQIMNQLEQKEIPTLDNY